MNGDRRCTEMGDVHYSCVMWEVYSCAVQLCDAGGVQLCSTVV